MNIVTALVSIMLLTSGCATVFSGSSQNVNIQAVSSVDNQILPGTVCIIRDGNGNTYAVPSNPASVIVKRGEGSLTPDCKKEGYKQITYGVTQSFNGVSLVNILFWPGFIVDAVTGSIHKYPAQVPVIMQPTNL